MRKDLSSREEAIAQLNKWRDEESLIKAIIVENWLMVSVIGRVMIFPEAENVQVVDRSEPFRVLVSFPILGDAFPEAEPLLDAPDEVKWRVDFFVGLTFPLRLGSVSLYEIPE